MSEKRNPARAILVRIGVDQAYGAWNAPVNVKTGEFVFVPIPDGVQKVCTPSNARGYDELDTPLENFERAHGVSGLRYPVALRQRNMHLDPDFEQLTYGDNGVRRGAGIAALTADDLMVFYAGLRSIAHPRELVYALVGMYVVEEVVRAITVPPARRHQNAHTRWTTVSQNDVVVRGSRNFRGVSTGVSRLVSGAKEPIGSAPTSKRRGVAFRLRMATFSAASFLLFSSAPKSSRTGCNSNALLWYRVIIELPKARVIIVHLRCPNRDPGEMRSDPFWEFGSFGITTCHRNNLMHPRNAEQLSGVRFAFAQGGRHGMRVVYLTPPVKIESHRDRIEAKWSPVEMPFRYRDAPILVSNREEGHFPQLAVSLKDGNRTTLEGQFSSNYRARLAAVGAPLAEELIRTYDTMRNAALPSAIASCYADALPWLPPVVDRDREGTYMKLFSEEAYETEAQAVCDKQSRNHATRKRNQKKHC